MRRHAKKDENHNAIVKILVNTGLSVLDLSRLGDDAPDILVGKMGTNLLVEIKNPETRGKLTTGQSTFFCLWRGPKMVAYYAEEILKYLKML